MPYRHALALVTSDLVKAAKVLLAAAFAVDPQYLVAIAGVFWIDVLMGLVSAHRKGAPIKLRDYLRANGYRLVEIACYIGLILLPFNLDPGLAVAKHWAFIMTVFGMAGLSIRRHFSRDIREQWVQVVGPVVERVQRTIETEPGKPNRVEHTIVTEDTSSEETEASGEDGIRPPPMLLLLVVLLGLGLALFGCRAPRVVTVQGEAPPPTVVARTDTLHLASPPDTLFAPPDTVRTVETVPVEVIRYLEPRPDTARAALVWRLSVDSSDVRLALRSEDLRLRAPAPGETLTCVARSAGRLDCRVEGVPSRPEAIQVECPGCPECLVTRSWGGRMKALLALLLTATLGGFIGFVAHAFLRSTAQPDE